MEIRLEHVSKYYYDQGKSTKGIEDVSLTLNSDSSFVVITGESGAGKSTLIRILTGLDDFDEGEIYFDGLPVSSMSEEEKENLYRNNISFVFQDYNLVESFTSKENIVLALLKQGKTLKEANRKALEVLDKVGLKKQANMRASKLSGGERQRVAIARSLALETKVIIFDEPTGNLDPETSRKIVELISQLKENRLIVYVTHEFSYVSDLVTRHIILSDGKVILDQNLLANGNQDTSKMNREKKKTGLASLAYASRLFSFRRVGRCIATTLILILSSFAVFGISILSTALLTSESSSFSLLFGNGGYTTSSKKENLTTPFGNQVSLTIDDTSKEKLDVSSLPDQPLLDQGGLVSICASNMELAQTDYYDTDVNLSAAYEPYIPEGEVKLNITYQDRNDASPIDIYLSEGWNVDDFKKQVSQSNMDHNLLQLRVSGEYYSSNSNDYTTLFLKEAMGTFSYPVYLRSVYTTTFRQDYFSSDESFFKPFRSAIASTVLDYLSTTKIDDPNFNPRLDCDSLTYYYSSDITSHIATSDDDSNPIEYNTILPVSLKDKDLSSIKITSSGTTFSLADLTEKDQIQYLPEAYSNAFYFEERLLREYVINHGGQDILYAKTSSKAKELVDYLSKNNTNYSFFQYDSSEGIKHKTIDFTSASVSTRLSSLLLMLRMLLFLFLILLVLRLILSKFYYRKDQDQMVLGWIGYSFRDMMKINAIQFILSTIIIDALIYSLMLTLIRPLKVLFLSFPYIFIFSVFINLFFAFYLSLPSHKIRRTAL